MLITIEFPEVILCLDALITFTKHKLNYIVPKINYCRISFKRIQDNLSNTIMKNQIQLTEVAAEMLKALTKQSKYRTEQDFLNNLITELYFQKKR